MAQITAGVVRVGKRQALGDRFVVTTRVPIVNANAPDEFFKVPGISWIDRIIGVVPVATLAGADEPDVAVTLRNSKVGTETGVEDTVTAGGFISIEGNARSWDVTVIGKF